MSDLFQALSTECRIILGASVCPLSLFAAHFYVKIDPDNVLLKIQQRERILSRSHEYTVRIESS
jgi:hypothetical protein